MIGERSFSNNARAEDIACVMYARLGFSIKTIVERTGLSSGAVNYRLKIMQVKLSDYRNGHSPLSQAVLKAASADSVRVLQEIKEHLPLLPPPKEPHATNG